MNLAILSTRQGNLVELKIAAALQKCGDRISFPVLRSPAAFKGDSMIIYKTTNLANGKIYVGRYTGKKKSYIGSGSTFRKEVDIYGVNNFKREILEEYSGAFIADREIYWILKLKAFDPQIGYNKILQYGNYSYASKIFLLAEEHPNEKIINIDYFFDIYKLRTLSAYFTLSFQDVSNCLGISVIYRKLYSKQEVRYGF
jgi:hypothetical protein